MKYTFLYSHLYGFHRDLFISAGFHSEGKQADDRAFMLQEGMRPEPEQEKSELCCFLVEKEGEKLLYRHLQCIQDKNIFDGYLQYL